MRKVIVEVKGLPEDIKGIAFGPPIGTPRYVPVRQRFRFDPDCERCFGKGIALDQHATAEGLAVTASTPCSCGQPDGVEVIDISNTFVIR